MADYHSEKSFLLWCIGISRDSIRVINNCVKITKGSTRQLCYSIIEHLQGELKGEVKDLMELEKQNAKK